MERLVVPFMTLVALVAFASTVDAQSKDDDERAREIFLEGEAAYASGDYDRAVQQFSESYRLSKRPALLFNIANAEERRGNFRQAANRLRAYLASPNPSDVDVIQKRIERLESRADEQERQESLSNSQSASSNGSTSVGGLARSFDEPSPSTDRSASTSSAAPGWALIGVGGALIAGGVVSGLFARSASSDAEDACGAGGFCPRSAEDDINQAKTLGLVADVTVVAGVGAVVIGGVLLWRHRKRTAESIAFDIGPTADGFAASLRGQF